MAGFVSDPIVSSGADLIGNASAALAEVRSYGAGLTLRLLPAPRCYFCVIAGEEEILRLFDDPEFLATHGLRGLFGAEATRDRVRVVLSRCGILRVSVSALPPESPCERS